MNAQPPRLARILLTLITPGPDRRFVRLDLKEEFDAMLAEGNGLGEARRWYWKQVLGSVAPLLSREGIGMRGVKDDARYAARAVRKDLGFFAFAALIIGLGVGGNTAVFSVMNPLMLRPLPFEQPDRLAWVALSSSGGMSSVTSRTSNLRDFRERSRSFEALTGYFAFFDYQSFNLVGDGEPERLVGVGVAGNFLDVLGVQPLFGRNFVEEETVWGGRQAVILTHAFWTRRYAADPGIVGTSFTLNDTAWDIVGVLPKTFDFASTFTPASRVDFLRPFPISDETDRQGNTLAIIGRLGPGSTVEGAQTELDGIVEQLQVEDPDRWGLGAVVTGLQDQISGRFRAAMFLLAAAAGAVMLIACANLSNLLLARSSKRRKEMAVRSVLGAGRGRIARQLLIESLMMTMSGAGIGVLIAFATTRAVAGMNAISIPMLRTVSVDRTALLFTLGMAVFAGLLLGIAPALQLSDKRNIASIHDASRGSSEGKRSKRIRDILVVAEVAMACTLLVGGGLLMRSFATVLEVDLGFEPDGVVAWRVDTNRNFQSLPEAVAYYDGLIERVEALPGVVATGLTDTMPLGRNRQWGIRAVGVHYEDGQAPTAFPRLVDHRYIQSMRISLVSGRHFTPDDNGDNTRVIILNEAAAERLFPGAEPIGRMVLFGGADDVEVVGVVEGVRHQSLEEGSGMEAYLPIAQTGWGTLELVVRSALPVESLIAGVQSAIRSTDPAMPTGDFRTLNDIVDRAVSPRRFTLTVLGSFAGVALLLAALGIYAVLSYSVSQSVPEIGIRMALGESASSVRRAVVGRTLRLAVSGLVLGALGSLAAGRLIASLLYGVEAADGVTFAGMAVLLLSVSLLAGYLPARRASRTDPIEALRAR